MTESTQQSPDKLFSFIKGFEEGESNLFAHPPSAERELDFLLQYDGVAYPVGQNFIRANVGNDGVVISFESFFIDSSNKTKKIRDWTKDTDGGWTGYIGKITPESSLSHRLGNIAADVEKDCKEWDSAGKPGDFREWRVGRIKNSFKKT